MPDASSHDFLWPLPRPDLARLIVAGLSDLNIAACFSVDREDVRLLRERYRLSDASVVGADNTRVAAQLLDRHSLDEISNGVQAAMSYANTAAKYASLDSGANPTTLLLIRKATEQLLRVGRAYQSLQSNAGPEVDV